MAITYDAYAFKPTAYTAMIAPYLGGLGRDQKSYTALRSAALNLFERNNHVKALLAEYGGWNRKSILAQIPLEYTGAPEDIAFWLLIFLYAQFRTNDPTMTWQSTSLSTMRYIAGFLNWSDEDQNLLACGKSFRSFAEKWLLSDSNETSSVMAYWEYLCPFSTSSHLGWLDHGDMERLLQQLSGAQQEISKLRIANLPSTSKFYNSTRDMFLTTLSKGACLCIIRSG